MKKFNHIYFCDYSQTYRSYPENYWLATVKNNDVIFDSWDGAIKNYSFREDVLNLHSEIEKCRNEHKKLIRQRSGNQGRFPVIVNSGYGLGVQFWTDWEIKNKVGTNSDKSKSYFIAKL